MRKRELLKRIEELEKAVAILQQKVANIENKSIAPIQINPWIKENPPYTYPRSPYTNPITTEPTFICAGDETSDYAITTN